jgi:aminopeptidase N
MISTKPHFVKINPRNQYKMRKSILLLGLVSQCLWSQHQDLIQHELKTYQKKAAFRTNPNASNYDLQYQRLELNLDPAVREVSGKVTSHFTPKSKMTDLYMDLDNALKVSKVSRYNPTTKAYADLVFSQAGTELKITHAAGFAATAKDSVSVTYSGVPPTANEAFEQKYQAGTNNPVLYSINEPYGAKDWFPTKESLDDKIARVDMIITAPSQYYAAGNGYLKSRTVNGSNATTWWRTNYAIPAYLVAFGLTNYKIKEEKIGPANAQFPFVNYVYPATFTNTTKMGNIDFTKQAMTMIIDKFGDYPFKNEKYGHMEFSWSGGMEHSTMSSMGTWDRSTIVHELGHQWFGDMVTCSSWNDIWINEGFAVFTEHLYNELIVSKDDVPGFTAYLQSELDKVTASKNGSVYVPTADLNNSNRIFSNELTYAKGGYVARMLKWVMGDANFYTGMKNFLKKYGYGYASTANLQAELEAVHGSSLKYFMDQWIYGQGYPTYTINYNQTANKDASFQINQVASDASVAFFQMPVPIRITGTGGEILNVVYKNTKNAEMFFQKVPFAISTVEFDPELQIVSKSNTVAKKSNQNTLGIDNTEIFNDKISIYPVPSSTEIYFSGLDNETLVEIYSIDGQYLQSINYTPNSAMSIAHLASGHYLAQIKGKAYKFIKP